MKKPTIVDVIILVGLIILGWLILVPSVSSSPRSNWQIAAKNNLRQLNVLYVTYTNSGPRHRHLNELNDLKEFAQKIGTDLSIFTTYDPLNKTETPVLYFKPETYTEDELVFVFRDPILPYEYESYQDEEMNRLKYVACYTKSGIVLLETKPEELYREWNGNPERKLIIKL